jgi:hypothetical protein
VHDYRIRFSAVDPEPLATDAAARLVLALEDMPGPERIGEAVQDDDARCVDAEFVIRVQHGMADAARDGSRLAKEGLKAANMPDATLVQMHVFRESEPET